MQIMAACWMVDVLFVSSRKDEQDMTKACPTSHGLGVRAEMAESTCLGSTLRITDLLLF